MDPKCPFFDTTLTSFYNKAHCGVYSEEISIERYTEICQSDKFCKCPYFIKLYEKIFSDDEETLERLNKLKGQTD